MKVVKPWKLVCLGVLLVVIDQIIKILVATNMHIGEQIPVFGNWFILCYVENAGMAFGMKFGGWIGKLLLSLFRIGLSGMLVLWIGSLNKRSEVPAGFLVGLVLITAGAIGNLCDCMFYGFVFDNAMAGAPFDFLFGKVVDMFYFPLWTWPDWVPLMGGDIFFAPVFNFADSCVTVGAFYLILFHWKFISEWK